MFSILGDILGLAEPWANVARNDSAQQLVSRMMAPTHHQFDPYLAQNAWVAAEPKPGECQITACAGRPWRDVA